MSPLTVDGTPLTIVTEYKCLGVTIASDLSWSSHIANVCTKSRRLTGMIYRRFYTNCSSHTLLKLYVSYVRPHLEYCSPVWNPHSKRHIEELERVHAEVCIESLHKIVGLQLRSLISHN